MGMTMAEKIMARAAGLSKLSAGEYVDCKLDGVMAILGFMATRTRVIAAGLPKVFDPAKVFLMIGGIFPLLKQRVEAEHLA